MNWIMENDGPRPRPRPRPDQSIRMASMGNGYRQYQRQSSIAANVRLMASMRIRKLDVKYGTFVKVRCSIRFCVQEVRSSMPRTVYAIGGTMPNASRSMSLYTKNKPSTIENAPYTHTHIFILVWWPIICTIFHPSSHAITLRVRHIHHLSQYNWLCGWLNYKKK